MRLPRDLDGVALARALRVLGYERVRQQGSHMRLTTQVRGEHHITIPAHRPLKIGTLLNGVLKPVAAHHGLTIEELLDMLFLC